LAINKIDEVIRFFETWYDYKAEPDDEKVEQAYREALVGLKSYLYGKAKRDFTTSEIKVSLGKAFGQWIKDNGLPKPRGE